MGERGCISQAKMGKRAAKVPLTLISPNEAACGTRSRNQGTPTSGPYEGKENGTPVRTTRRGIRSAATTSKEHHMETSRSPKKHKKTVSSQKRARLAVTGPSVSGLCAGDEILSREDNIACSQTGAAFPVCKDFLSDDDKGIKNVEIIASAEGCSPPDDDMRNGAPVRTTIEHHPDFSGCPDEHRRVAWSLDQNMLTAEVTATAIAIVPTEQGSPERPGRECSASGSASQLRQIASTKAKSRKAVGEDTSKSTTIPDKVCGTSTVAPKPPFREQHEKIESSHFSGGDNLQATVALATDTLQNAYDKLYTKYQQLKTKQFADAEAAFDEQSRRIEVFSTAAQDLVQNLRTTNSAWEYQEDVISRSRLMEVAYIECQNDLVMERAKNLELRQELENAERHGSKLRQELEIAELHGSKLRQGLEIAELHGSKLLAEVLENVTDLRISNYGKSEIIFSHNQTGFEFKLEQNKLSEEVGGKDALLYNVVAPGTIFHAVPEWMLSEIVFDITQIQIFLRRVLAVALCGGDRM